MLPVNFQAIWMVPTFQGLPGFYIKKFFRKSAIGNRLTLVKVMAWYQTGNKLLPAMLKNKLYKKAFGFTSPQCVNIELDKNKTLNEYVNTKTCWQHELWL